LGSIGRKQKKLYSVADSDITSAARRRQVELGGTRFQHIDEPLGGTAPTCFLSGSPIAGESIPQESPERG
jgi:hypothetical protein